MNYDFLQSYNIPTVSQQGGGKNQYDAASTNYTTIEGAYGTYSTETTPPTTTPGINPNYYGYGGGANQAYNQNYEGNIGGETYQNPNRFIPPSKHGTGYSPIKPNLKRKYNALPGSGKKAETSIVEVTSDGKMVMFVGRDETYPEELNALIHPLTCDLCNIKMNSRTSAKDHYESKCHDKNISSWLCKNYTEKGLNPPDVKRFIKQGPCGPDAFYCEVCDLKLTSLTHASQHYAGKKHRLVISQRAKPSGAGYYNSEGKWVRTGTKITPNQYKDRRFGIGDPFNHGGKPSAESVDNTSERPTTPTPTTTSVADTTTTTNEFDPIPIIADTTKPTVLTTTTQDQDPSLFCTICKVSVTSAVQMTMHLSGIKHQKKLKLSGITPPTPAFSVATTNEPPLTVVLPPTSIVDNVLFSAIKEEIKPDPTDLSMYRTPSGQYYCKTCNTTMSHLPGLEQHLKGKRHLKKQAEEKAVASLAVKKIN